MGDFAEKVVLITGADRGIGQALALAFGEQGAIVAANALTPVNLDETILQIHARGGHAKAYVADIASKLALQTMLHEIIDQFGRLDILIQTASVDPPDELLEIDEWDWRRMVDSNLTGPFLLMQSASRLMRSQGGGVIINIVCPDENSAAATAGKMGLLALTNAAASEFGAYNIQINAIRCDLSGEQKRAELPEDLVALVFSTCTGGAVE
jgi:3-oxoacyl-[acyl-carrier protein] reductase